MDVDFGGLCAAQVTRDIDQCENYVKQLTVGLVVWCSTLDFTFISQGIDVWELRNCNFYEFWEYTRPVRMFFWVDLYKIFRIYRRCFANFVCMMHNSVLLAQRVKSDALSHCSIGRMNSNINTLPVAYR